MPAMNMSFDDETYALVATMARENDLTLSKANRNLVKLGWAHLSGCLAKSKNELEEAVHDQKSLPS